CDIRSPACRYLESMNESPEVALRGVRISASSTSGRVNRNGGARKAGPVCKQCMDRCAERGAHDVAECAEALGLAASSAGTVAAPRTETRVLRSTQLSIFATTHSKSLGIRSSYVIAGRVASWSGGFSKPGKPLSVPGGHDRRKRIPSPAPAPRGARAAVLDPAGEEQHDHHHQEDGQQSARGIPPTPAVGPGRDGTEDQQDQDDEENGA